MTTPSGNPGSVAPGQTIESTWGNSTAFRVVTRFIDTVERDTYWGSFVENGNVAWVDSAKVLQVFIDGTWFEVLRRTVAESLFVRLTGSIMTGALTAPRFITSQAMNDSDKAARNIAIGTAPSTALVGDLWIDTVTTPNQLRRWNGSEWTVLLVSA